MIKAVIFKSEERFESFKNKLIDYGIDPVILDFDEMDWIDYDFSDTDIVIYYPSFRFSSNHPLALQRVYDNILFVHLSYPKVVMYPDPEIIRFFNDKYRQFLFLNKNGYPIPETIPLFSGKSLKMAEKRLGYPMIVKNRFGAGGGSVFRVFNRKELNEIYQMSQMNLFHIGAFKYFGSLLRKRIFYWHLIKAKKAVYPFFSPPILAQKFIHIDRDLKTVVGNGKVVEAHWRHQADDSMWKMNIDGGGTGVWGYVPEEALGLSVRLSKELFSNWLNLDLVMSNGNFLITEFSPVWHHYSYKEKPNFIYKDDYNLEVPLEISLDLERIIVESLIDRVKRRTLGGSLD